MSSKLMYNLLNVKSVPAEEGVASYADALWACHTIFLPHKPLLKQTADSFPLFVKISWRSCWELGQCELLNVTLNSL